MANNENLIPLNKRTPRERKEISSKGANACNEKKRERKKLREELAILLENEQMQEKICTALLRQAQRGNTKAFEIIRDTIGEKPTDKLDIGASDGSFNITVEYVSNDKTSNDSISTDT